MQIFGLLALLIAVCGGVYMAWFSDGASTAPVTNESRLETYNEAISGAKEAVKSVSSTGSSVEIYNGISVNTNTTNIDLSGEALTGSLKAEIRLVSKLEELNLSGNNFTGLPAEVGQLSELRVLNLSGNPITGLPYEIGNLQKLEVLDLRSTSYAKQDLEIIKSKLPKTTTILVD
jgi:Leucine-rich repeat (LRR) protein